MEAANPPAANPPAANGTGLSAIKAMIPVVTALVVIWAVVGGALVILSATLDSIDPALRLTFKEYLDQMGPAVAGLAVGRGVTAHAKATATQP
jgi:hypothetical protein